MKQILNKDWEQYKTLIIYYATKVGTNSRGVSWSW